jgi:hypothetical protein
VENENSCTFTLVFAETVAIFKSIEATLKTRLPERNNPRRPTSLWQITRLSVLQYDR